MQADVGRLTNNVDTSLPIIAKLYHRIDILNEHNAINPDLYSLLKSTRLSLNNRPLSPH